MSDSGGIPELQGTHPDGRLRTRLEMDQWIRQEVPKVHWLRLHASRTFSLPKQIAWDMREIVLRHWLLDEMIRRQLISGDQLGVNATTSNDDSELRQFTQRLAALIQAGHAVQPQHAEGVDMNGYTPPPPPVMGGAPAPQGGPSPYQPGPPPAPPGPPGVTMPPGYPPPQPPGPPQQQFQPQPGPPAPMGPPGGYASPPAGVPMAPPQQQMQQPPMGPPGAPPGPPAAGGRRARKDPAQQQVAPPAAPVPPMGAPQQFAPAGFSQPPAPQGFAPPMPQAASYPQAAPQQAAPQIDLSGMQAKLDQVLNNLHSMAARNTVLERKVDLLSMMNTVLCRGIYQKGGSADVSAFLTELGVPLPQ